MKNNDPIAVFWFRRDLRLQDNRGLYFALKNDLPVLPFFIFDKNILDDLEEKDDVRLTFIHQELQKINDLLGEKGTSLIIKYTTPEDAWKKLLREWNVKKVFTNHDYEPYAKERDERIGSMLRANNIELQTYKDQVIFETNDILSASGEPYKIFTPYKRQWLSQLASDDTKRYSSALRFENWVEIKPQKMPSLNSMGYSENTYIPIPDSNLSDEILKKYADLRDIPAVEGTSRMSHHLRFGTVSIRSLVDRAKDMSEVYLNELIWREFYMQILYHHPHVVNHSFYKKYDQLNWRNNEKEFELWCEGKTGIPIVDAGMRQLNSEAYMHNRVRMITASFLTKNLLVDWRWGEAYFAQKLLDYELSSNNGGWQWAAGTGTDAAPYFRIFNPATQQKKYDPELVYIRKYIPEYGTDKYPEPIVDLKGSRERALREYKKVV